MPAVVFDPTEFKTVYPQFKDLSADVLGNNFILASSALDNTGKSPVKNLDERKALLYLLTAHITELYNVQGGGSVGNTASGSQGSISVSFSGPKTQSWYSQTQWGYLFWQLTAKYRLGGRYIKWSAEE